MHVGYQRNVAHFAAGARATCIETTDAVLSCFGDPSDPLGDASISTELESFEPFSVEERARGHLEGGMPDPVQLQALAAAITQAVARKRTPTKLGEALLRDRGGELFVYVGPEQFRYLLCHQLQSALRRTLGVDLQLAATGVDLWADDAQVAAHFPEDHRQPGLVVNGSKGLAARLPRALGKLGQVDEVAAGLPSGVRLFALQGPLAVALLGDNHAIAGPPDALGRWIAAAQTAKLQPPKATGCGLRRAQVDHSLAPQRLEITTAPSPANDPDSFRLRGLIELASEDAARHLEAQVGSALDANPLAQMMGLARGEADAIANLMVRALGEGLPEHVQRRGATLTFEQNARVHSGNGLAVSLFAFALSGGTEQGLP